MAQISWTCSTDTSTAWSVVANSWMVPKSFQAPESLRPHSSGCYPPRTRCAKFPGGKMRTAVHDPLILHSDPEVAEMRRRAVSKAAWRFLPVLTIAYILNYLDRTSVGIAALTMNRDLGLTAYQFGWGAGYTHRVAISNRRLLAFNEASVTFR